MPRYIDADLLIYNELIPLSQRIFLGHPKQAYGILIAKSKIDEQPTANVQEIKHGKWVDNNNIAWECSICHKSLVVEQGTADMNYCPHCGAKNR